MNDRVAREFSSEDALAEVAGCVGLLERSGKAAVREIEFATDVDECMANLQRIRRNQH